MGGETNNNIEGCGKETYSEKHKMNYQRHERKYRDYRDALSKAGQGNSWIPLPGVTWHGLREGLTEEQIIADYRALGIDRRDADVRRECKSARDKLAAHPCARPTGRRLWHPVAKPKLDPYIIRAMDYIERGRRALSDWLEVEDASRLPVCVVMQAVWDFTTGRRERLKPLGQSIAYLQEISHGDGSLFFEVRADKSHRLPEVGKGIRTAGELISELSAGRQIGEIMSANPLTGKQLPNASGKLSYVGRANVAAFPHMLMEFDELPLKDQCFFWVGVLMSRDLDIFSLTYSGKKSVHALIETGAENVEDFMEVKRAIVRRFSLRRDHPRFKEADAKYCPDEQALTPEVGARLPGAFRAEVDKWGKPVLDEHGKPKGVKQEMLFLRAFAADF